MKKYFMATSNLEIKITGTFPQCSSFVKGTPKTDIEDFYSYLDYFDANIESFPPQMPRLNGYKLHGWAKPTNFLSHVTSDLLLMDKKALDIFEKFNLGDYKVIPTKILFKKNYLDYYFVYIVSGLFKYLDVKKSKYKITSYINEPSHRILDEGIPELNTWEEFSEWRYYLKEHDGYPIPTEIVFSKDCPKDIDLFRLPCFPTLGYFVSKDLKNAITQNGLTGWLFEDYPKIIFDERS